MLKTVQARGISNGLVPVTIRNSSGSDRLRGDALCPDILNSSTLATDGKEGSPDSWLFHMVDPDGSLVVASATSNWGSMCIVVILAEDIADGQEGKAWIEGPSVMAKCTGPLIAHNVLSIEPAGAGTALVDNIIGSHKTVAFSHASLGAVTAVIPVYLEGYHGFGLT